METAISATYKLNPELWEKNRIGIKRMQAALVFLPVVVVVGVESIRDGRFWLSMSTQGLATMALWLALICGVGWFFALGRIAKAKKKYDSFELTLSAEGLLRKQALVPDLYIPYTDIASITVIEGKGTAIRRKSDGVLLWIADEMDHYREVVASLRPYAGAYSEPRIAPVWAQPWITIAGMLVGFALLLLSDRIAIVLVGTALLAFACAMDFWKLRYSAGVDRVQKRQLWVMPLIAIFVLFKLLALLRR